MATRHRPKFEDFDQIPRLPRCFGRNESKHGDGRAPCRWPVSIHALEGKIRIRLPEEHIEVSAGELMALDYGIPHEIEALEESAFLLTISWPGGTKEERHAWKQSVP
jgi:hypothetical protein